MGQLDGKIAIVPGASSGIGRETALLFAEHGAKLVLVARRLNELKRLVQEIRNGGAEAAVVAGDVRDSDVARSGRGHHAAVRRSECRLQQCRHHRARRPRSPT